MTVMVAEDFGDGAEFREGRSLVAEGNAESADDGELDVAGRNLSVRGEGEEPFGGAWCGEAGAA